MEGIMTLLTTSKKDHVDEIIELKKDVNYFKNKVFIVILSCNFVLITYMITVPHQR